MLRELVGNLSGHQRGLSTCSRRPVKLWANALACGGDVAELQKGFFCQTESCKFAIWKNNKWMGNEA